MVWSLGDELGGEVAVGDGDVTGDEGAEAGLAGTGVFAERGLVAVSELFFLPGEDWAEVKTQDEEEEEKEIAVFHWGFHG
jgi:hypothetical protein